MSKIKIATTTTVQDTVVNTFNINCIAALALVNQEDLIKTNYSAVYDGLTITYTLQIVYYKYNA